MLKVQAKSLIVFFVGLSMHLYSAGTSAQSAEQQFPTPVSTNEINGTIRARDIGDSRLTTYFFTFNGSQGDLFINVVTNNLSADIDLFIEQELRPLTKIVVYADRGETETGRVVYLRQSEKLLLRVQGRTPNDDPGMFRVKFAGGFRAAADSVVSPPELPKAEVPGEPAVSVNSVGTIIEQTPKTIPDISQTDPDVPNIGEPVPPASQETPAALSKQPISKGKPEVIITDNLPAPDVPVNEPKRSRRATTSGARPAGIKRDDPNPDPREIQKEAEPDTPRKEDTPPADPMAAFHLVVIFKNGSRIERPMLEVRRFVVDKGVLVITSKDGSVGRYEIAEIESVSIN